MRTVGIVGVGNMGGGMAAHLLEQGWHVRVHDIDRGKVEGLRGAGAIGDDAMRVVHRELDLEEARLDL